MTKEELMKQSSFEIKLTGAGMKEEEDGSTTFMAQCNIQTFDLEKKVTLKAVSGVIGSGKSVLEAENSAIDRACELLGEV